MRENEEKEEEKRKEKRGFLGFGRPTIYFFKNKHIYKLYSNTRANPAQVDEKKFCPYGHNKGKNL